MSDHTVKNSESKYYQKNILSNENIREPSLPYQARWMSHWMQTCSTSSSHSCKHHVVSDTSNELDRGYIIIGRVQSKEANMLSEDINTRNTFDCSTMRKSDPREFNLTSDVLQSDEIVGAENKIFNITHNSVVRDASSFDSTRNLPDFYKNQKNFNTNHFMNSENLSLWEHFPMFDINRKMDSILAPKKSGYSTVSGRMSEPHLLPCESTLAPHVIKFASEKHRVEARSISQCTDQGKRPRESMKGLLPYGDDLTGSSHSAFHRSKCHRSNMSSCIYTREEDDPFAYKEHFSSTNLMHLDHGICNCSSHSTLMVLKMKNGNEMIAKNIGSSWARFQNGSMQLLRESCPGDFCLPFLAGECGKEVKSISGNELLHNHRSIHGSSKVDSSRYVNSTHKMPKYSCHDLETLGACTTLDSLVNAKIEPQRFSNEAQYLLITNKMGMDLSHKDQMIRKSTISTEVKGTASFEMPVSHCHCQHKGNLHPPLISMDDEDREDGIGIDTHSIEMPNGSSDKTDTVYANVSQIPSSLEGLISSNSQKGLVSHNLMESKSKAGSPIQKAFFNNASSIRELNASGIESMSTDHELSNFEKPDNSTPLLETSSSPETRNRWLKCARHYPLYSHALPTKRLKTGDALYSGQSQNLFRSILDHNNSRQKGFDNIQLSTKDNECSSGEKKAMHYWIRRWRCRSQQATPRPKLSPTVLCEPVTSKDIKENFEGKQLPSITAMALMGRAANNFRRCQFQRKGSLVVWNTRDSEID